jgi:hypothetical protein
MNDVSYKEGFGREITTEEVESAIFRLKTGTAPGPDKQELLLHPMQLCSPPALCGIHIALSFICVLVYRPLLVRLSFLLWSIVMKFVAS